MAARSIDFRQHGSLVGIPVTTNTETEERIMMARSITVSRVHRRLCNSHGILDIKMAILQGRTEQKLDWHFDLRNTTALTQS
jgi:hypothetical protein